MMHRKHTLAVQQLLQQHVSNGEVPNDMAESTCMAHLVSSKKAAKVYSDWMADLSEVMDDSPLKLKAASKTKDNTKEVDQLKKQIQAAVNKMALR